MEPARQLFLARGPIRIPHVQKRLELGGYAALLLGMAEQGLENATLGQSNVRQPPAMKSSVCVCVCVCACVFQVCSSNH